MSIAEFLRELAASGRARVGPDFPAPPPGEELTPLLRELERRARAEAPCAAPPFGLDAARWGARTLHAAAQALTFRHLPLEGVARELRRPCPGSPSPGRSWSVDLCLRWLPDLFALTCALPDGHPLPGLLAELGAAWPLSSPGLRLGPLTLDAAELEVVLGDPCLSRLHVERALQRRDAARLREPRARELARAALGEHPELCPAVAGALAGEPA